MALDGALLHLLTKELNCIIDTKIDKIHQPSRDELIFVLRKSGFNERLFISVKSGRARISLTKEKPENPASPPMFCMLMRKHLIGARVTDIIQPSFERIVHIKLNAFNELGDKIVYTLTVELISNQANIILSDPNGKIIDSLKRSDIESGKRLIQPGAKYIPPTDLEKTNPLNVSFEEFLNAIKEHGGVLQKAILDKFDGISPLIAREICYKADTFDTRFSELTTQNVNILKEVFNEFKNALLYNGKPILVYKNGVPFDFSYMPITQYGKVCENKPLETFCSLLDEYYTSLDLADRLKNHSSAIEKTIKNAIARTSKKIQLRTADLKKCESRDSLRIYGELIKANIHKISQGDTIAKLENYYDENLAEIEIPLNPALTPVGNAAKYFKEYKKTYSIEQHLTQLIQADYNELEYLESVLDSLYRAQSIADINEIRDELSSEGYIHYPNKSNKIKPSANFNEYISPQGYKILVGKNNRQNDLLTLKIADKNDMWFHTKNIPGSHVIVFCSGKELGEDTILFAAKLAACNSKAKNSGSVPVDYTSVKFVKKPTGAKPGMVIYSTNRTVFVTP